MSYWHYIESFYNLSWPLDRPPVEAVESTAELHTAIRASLTIWGFSFLPAATCELIRFRRAQFVPYTSIAAVWHAVVLMHLLYFSYDPSFERTPIDHRHAYVLIYGLVALTSFLSIGFSFILPLADALTETKKSSKLLLYSQAALLLVAYPVFNRGAIWYLRMYLETSLHL